MLKIPSGGGGGGGLPSEYQQVEYIANTTGGEYIATSFCPVKVPTYSMLISISTSSLQYGDKMLFGAQDGDYLEPYQWYTNSQRWYGRTGTSKYNNVTSTVSDISGIIEITMSPDALTVNDQSLLPTSGTATRATPIYVFAWNNNGAAQYKMPAPTAIYYLRAVADGDDLLNLIPVYRKADGVIGLFDTVSQTFYTNAGTGAFTKGTDV